MNVSFDWSTVHAESFAYGVVWCAASYLVMALGDRLMGAAFEALERVGEKRRERRREEKARKTAEQRFMESEAGFVVSSEVYSALHPDHQKEDQDHVR